MKFKFNLDTEVICGHEVTAETKKIWRKQLDMLEKLDEVCEKYNLKYFVSGGTLIGAVRHQGYIPWDDDIDVHMLAEDYEKLSSVAKEEMKPYTWQDWRTEPGFYPWHAKIRNDNTTGSTVWELENWPEDMSKGIFIDVFPLHYIPDSMLVRGLQKFVILSLRYCITALIAERRFRLHPERWPYRRWLNVRLNLARVLHCIPPLNSIPKLSQKYMRACSWQKKPSKRVGAISFDVRVKRFTWPSEYYRETVRLPFMGDMVSAPIEWDACLRQQYGDYHVIVKNGSMHSSIIFDTETSWKERLVGELEKHEPFLGPKQRKGKKK